MNYVSYLRVSTTRQGISGLGLEAQRKAGTDFGACRGEVLSEYCEIESGKRADRPQLALALADAKRSGAVLLIAKLDRLSRNVAFIANLLEGGVEIVAADNPNANRMMLQMYSVFAEEEGRAISERTKAALAAAKARGVKLGWAIPSRAGQQQEAAQKGAEQIKSAADQFAANIMPVIEQVKATGTTSLRGIAGQLNQRGLKTARGGAWYAGTVQNILARS